MGYLHCCLSMNNFAQCLGCCVWGPDEGNVAVGLFGRIGIVIIPNDAHVDRSKHAKGVHWLD